MLNAYIKEPQQQAQACVVWMHGLGADASDMSGLASQLTLDDAPIRHVSLDAPVRPITINNGMPMRGWYDIFDLSFRNREDRQGVLDSQAQIMQVIQAQMDQGMPSNKIFLAGFSQGGAMALYTALNSTLPLAGVIALSSYLPLVQECNPSQQKDTPMFLGYGKHDPLVLPAWSKLTIEWLSVNGYTNLSEHSYPMEHSICYEEINDLSMWLSSQLKGDIE